MASKTLPLFSFRKPWIGVRGIYMNDSGQAQVHPLSYT